MLAGKPAPEGGQGGYLTLRRLVVWLGEGRARLRCLALLADSGAGLPGAQLVATLAAHAQHGQPLLRATVRRNGALSSLPSVCLGVCPCVCLCVPCVCVCVMCVCAAS